MSKSKQKPYTVCGDLPLRLVTVKGIYDNGTVVDTETGEVFEKCYYQYTVIPQGYYFLKIYPKYTRIFKSIAEE